MRVHVDMYEVRAHVCMRSFKCILVLCCSDI